MIPRKTARTLASRWLEVNQWGTECADGDGDQAIANALLDMAAHLEWLARNVLGQDWAGNEITD